MPANPYEPPKEDASEVQPKRWLVLVALGVLAVPAASVAGFATCLGTTYAEHTMDLFGREFQNVRVLACVVLGAAASFAVLFVSALPRSRERRHAALFAAVGMLGAAPVALVVFAGSFAAAYGTPATDSLGGNIYFYAGCLAFFLVMNIGGWMGLRYERKAPR